jgi:peptidoglycan hydrolase CwlO-like protein
MNGRSLRAGIGRWASVAVIACLVAALLPSTAVAAPSSSSLAHSISARQAQVAAATKELAGLGSQLTSALAQFDDVTTQLDAARNDTAATSERIAELEAEIDDRQTALDDRAVAMYKSGQLEVVQALLSVGSFDDLLSRVDLLSYIQQSDAELVSGLSTARDQASFLEQQQTQRENDLVALRTQADARKAAVDAAVARQKQVMSSLSAQIVRLVKQKQAADAAAAAAAMQSGQAPPVPFQTGTVISDSAYLASDSMTEAGIQAFLTAQGGALKSYSGPDHNGVTMTAAQMIADAAAAWKVSPKVILVTLQKEQSLISDRSPSRNALDWAMGCGKTDSVTYEQYKGFGNQIWGGAQKLISNRAFWHSGISLVIDGTVVYPTNASTCAQYRYTPHFHGVESFWNLYWRYFGNPLA